MLTPFLKCFLLNVIDNWILDAPSSDAKTDLAKIFLFACAIRGMKAIPFR
jgi:hypothetical protein